MTTEIESLNNHEELYKYLLDIVFPSKTTDGIVYKFLKSVESTDMFKFVKFNVYIDSPFAANICKHARTYILDGYRYYSKIVSFIEDVEDNIDSVVSLYGENKANNYIYYLNSKIIDEYNQLYKIHNFYQEIIQFCNCFKKSLATYDPNDPRMSLDSVHYICMQLTNLTAKNDRNNILSGESYTKQYYNLFYHIEHWEKYLGKPFKNRK